MYIVPYVPRIDYPQSFPYEYEDEEEYYMLKANIKELQKEIKKMGKQEYLKQRKINRKGATAAYNEAFKQVKQTFSNIKKNADTGATKGFKKRVFKRLRERPGKIGFELLAKKNRINLIELFDGPPKPTKVRGIAKYARDRVWFKIRNKRVRGKREFFVAKKRTKTGYYTGVFFKKPDNPWPIAAGTASHSHRLERPEKQEAITEKALKAMAKEAQKV